jgi:alkylation response protein AidB-like acyl-CoA dehydrogenase
LDETRHDSRFDRAGDELSKRVKAFTEKHLKPLTARIEAEEYFPRDFARSAETGFWGLPSRDLMAASAVSGAAEMARLASAALLRAACIFRTSVQKKEFLRPVLLGEKVGGALALTEPRAGSDAGSIKTRARREGRDFILNEEKRLITNGGVADYLFLFPVTPANLLDQRSAHS